MLCNCLPAGCRSPCKALLSYLIPYFCVWLSCTKTSPSERSCVDIGESGYSGILMVLRHNEFGRLCMLMLHVCLRRQQMRTRCGTMRRRWWRTRTGSARRMCCASPRSRWGSPWSAWRARSCSGWTAWASTSLLPPLGARGPRRGPPLPSRHMTPCMAPRRAECCGLNLPGQH